MTVDAPRLPSRLRPSRLELHSGILVGTTPRPVRHWPGPGDADPRAGLERHLAGVLCNGPAVVKFSGGRDSSLVLAVAAHVARREGFPLPVAVSLRYADAASTHEADWQDLVVAHLGVPHEIVHVPRGADELAGPLAVSRLVRYGPLLPPVGAVGLARIAGVAEGRPVLTGEGGDEMLGASRVTELAGHIRRRRRPSRAGLASMAGELLPRAVRRARAERLIAAQTPTPWLRPAARDTVTRALADHDSDQLWDWRAARRQYLDSHLVDIGFGTTDWLAEQEGLVVEHPLLHEDFVAALCRRAGRWGMTTRSEAMRALAGDLLPEAVLTRRTKASFNDAYAADRVRAFARVWSGAGVDEDLVDVEALRAAWSEPVVPGLSLAALQLALTAALAEGWAPDDDVEAVRVTHA